MSSDTSPQSVKKLRNRLSQQAFRRRRAELIKDLRERAGTNQVSESEALAKARDENTKLRTQLAEVHSKMNSMLAAVQILVQNTAPRTGKGPSASDKGKAWDQNTEQITQQSNQQAEMTFSAAQSPAQMAMPHLEQPQMVSQDWAYPFSLYPLGLEQSTPSDIPRSLPQVWSLEYQMGHGVYATLYDNCQQLSQARGQAWAESNSPFSDHIEFLQSEVSRLSELPESPWSTSMLYLATASALSMFYTISRHNAMQWYAHTKFRYTRDITVWRIRPTLETFERLHPHYQPTMRQMQIKHAAVIDWVPYPAVRDCLIQYHSANPCIDQIVSDIVSSYVVETTLDNLVANSPQLQIYIRVVDLVCAQTVPGCKTSGALVSLPVPKISDIFDSPQASRAVSDLLGIEEGLSRYKLDPDLFLKYPELYADAGSLVAQGAPLKPETPSTLAFPKSLDDRTASLYRDFIRFNFLDQFV